MLGLPSVAAAAPSFDPATSPTKTAPSLSWSDPDGAVVYQISRGGPGCVTLVPLGTVTAPTTSFDDSPGPADGSYCYQVESFSDPDLDPSHSLGSDTVNVVVDTVTNTPVFTAPLNGAIVRGTRNVTFTNDDDATPVDTTVSISPHAANTFSALPGTSWDTTNETDGDYDVQIASQDALLNAVATATITVTVDNTAPSLSLTTFPADTAAVRGTVNTTFSVSDLTTTVSAKLQYDPPGGGANWTDATTTPITNGLAWNSAGVADGDYGLRVVATDGAGNTTIRPSSSVTVTVDNTAPTAAAFTGNPQSGTTYGRGAISVAYSGGTDGGSGIASIALQAQVNGTPTWVTKASGTSSPISWTPTAPDDCTCSFRLLATDHAGNQTASAVNRTSVKIDGFDPVAPTVFSIDRTMTNGPPKLTWSKSASGDVAGYRIVRDTINFPTGGALLPKTQLSYTDNSLLRDGTVDGAHGYQLYAVDQSGNASVAKVANFFLDSVPPTTPTLPHAKRRAGKAIVDLGWSGSVDNLPPGSNPAPPSGVARYVVRRAVGAAPASVTAGQLACDVPAAQLACADTPPEGATYLYSIFAVDAASNPSLAAHAGPVAVPDVTAPGPPTAFKVRKKGLTMAFTWVLPKAGDLKKIVIVRSSVHSPRSLTDGKAVFSGKTTKANVRQLGGTRAWYKAFAVDNAGNASPSAGLQVVQPVFKLFPENGTDLRGSSRLRWKKSKRASYYNVQVYLGSKRITQAWPRGTSFRIPKSKLRKGKVYTWYVWPGIGSKSRGRYGNMIGKSTFTWLG